MDTIDKTKCGFALIWFCTTLLLLQSSQTAAFAQSSFDCTVVTEIPTAECTALVALYTSTNGDNWYDHTREGWLQTTTPCTWYGIACTDGSVTRIDKFADGLVGEIPAELADLPQLTSLDLTGNEITAIPPEIGRLLTLTDLYIGSNQLQTVPAEIISLTQLATLDLHANQLVTLPIEIGNLTNLTSLDLTNNQLQIVPAEIGNLTELTRLNLDGNPLPSLPDEIGNLSNLGSLGLSDTQLTQWPETLQMLNIGSLSIHNLCEPAGFDAWFDSIVYVLGRTEIPCEDVRFSGRVWIEDDTVDGFTGHDHPLDGITVTLTTPFDIITTTTDSEGLYHIDTLPFTQYTITVDSTDSFYTLPPTHTLSPETPHITQTFVTVFTYDYSDAPLTYGSAAHRVNSSLYLGGGVEGDSATQPTYEQIDLDNDDGVAVPTTIVSHEDLIVVVYVVNEADEDAYLYGFVDTNGNEIFELSEHSDPILIPAGFIGTIPLNLGEATVGYTRDIVLRVRITTDEDVTPFGIASDGEVEDYPLTVRVSPPYDPYDYYGEGVTTAVDMTTVTTAARTPFFVISLLYTLWVIILVVNVKREQVH